MATLIGQTLEIEFAEEEHRGRKGLKAGQKIGGRYAFPDRRGPQPADGDIWRVEVIAENPSGSVYFLRCIERVSTEAERRAAAQAARQESETLWQRHQNLRPAVQDWLNSFSQWDVKEHPFELEGVAMILRPRVKSFSSSADGLVLSIEPQVEYLGNTSTFEKIEVVISWADLQVERIYLREPGSWRQVTAVVATSYGRYELFFGPYAGQVEFLGWEREDKKLLARVKMGLNGIEEEAAFVVAEFSVQEGKGKLDWKVSDWSRSQPERADAHIPQTPQEHLAWLDQLVASHEEFGRRMERLGLLSISRGVGDRLREFGGVGYASWAKLGEKERGRVIIHPGLAPLVEGLGVELTPLEMVEDAPEEAWYSIVWFVGEEPPSADEIERLCSETLEVEEQVPLQNWLGEYGREKRALPCTIVCQETPDGKGRWGDTPAKYVFSAKVASPVVIRTYRKNTFGAYYKPEAGPVLNERTEARPDGHTFENIAYGNEFFEGQAELEVFRAETRRSYEWAVRWQAPETHGEETERKAEAIRKVIAVARQGAVLTGWRFEATGNPVVYMRTANDIWSPREFFRDSFDFGRHKGYCSTKADFWSDRDPHPTQINHALANWPFGVVQDGDWREKIGQSILSLFPTELIQKLGGG